MSRESGERLARLELLWVGVYLTGALLALRLVQLQILQRAEYQQLAEMNATKIIHQTAPRGVIYDRRGTPVAANQEAFSLIYIPPKKGQPAPDLEFLAGQLARELGRDRDDLLETLQQAVHEETALRLAENLPRTAMFRLSELKAIYPGVELIVEARRHYPFGRFASHLLGYMGKMDSRAWRALKSKGYRVDARIGKIGLEAALEAELRGHDGGLRMLVDAQGRLKKKLESFPGLAGSGVHLTIDEAVQKAADEGLRGSGTGKGAVVALDPRSGAILALASAPDFDPNAFLSSDPKVVKQTAASAEEFNRAISGTYAPGSTFKVVVGAAGLNEGRFTIDDAIFCPGYLEWGKNIFLCWEHRGHKRMTWFPALTQSCDVYFYRMGLRTGGPLIEKYGRMFGLGAKTGIALKGEQPGKLFGPAMREKAGLPWYDGDTINLSIGQGAMVVTPIQMAVLMAAVANGGTVWRPYYIDHIAYADGRPAFKQSPEKLGQVTLQDHAWWDLHEAMRLAVSSGTGVAARVAGLEVEGKTGTAQNPAGADHAWFISAAARPGELPGVAVAVLVEHGGHGASAAGPIARTVMMAAYGMEDKKPAAAAKPGAPGLEAMPRVGVPVPARVR
ncbi:MAG: penicillin-binding protein 2 [Elusimicrobia bacterium]|nr:penicillin-binding protein 2 [Elusimicrobiota bacterium]